MRSPSPKIISLVWTEQAARRLDDAAGHVGTAALSAGHARASYLFSLQNVREGLRRLAAAARSQSPSTLWDTFALRLGLLHRAVVAALPDVTSKDAEIPNYLGAVRELLADLEDLLLRPDPVSPWEGDDVAERLDMGADLLDVVALLAHRARTEEIATFLSSASCLRYAADEVREGSWQSDTSALCTTLRAVEHVLVGRGVAPSCASVDGIPLVRAEGILAALVAEAEEMEQVFRQRGPRALHHKISSPRSRA